MAEDPEQVEYGKDYLVLVCKQYGHVDRIKSIPGDQEGQPYKSFQSQCSKCKTIRTAQLSEIRSARAHPKH